MDETLQQLTGERIVEPRFSIDDIAHSLRVLASRRFRQAERIWLLRSMLSPTASLRWSAFICEYYIRYVQSPPSTAVLSRPLRNFGRRGLSPAGRVDLMYRHYAMMEQRFRSELLAGLCRDSLLDLVMLESKGVHFRIGLCNSARLTMPREGELVFFFQNTETGTILAKKSVFLGMVEQKPVLIIGGLQGSPGAKTSIIAATRKMHGLRPKDAVLLAVRAFAHVAGIEDVHAVGNSSHVITADNQRRKFSDYDDYWVERGAKPAQPYGFRMLSEVEPVEGGKGRDEIKRRIVAGVEAMVVSWHKRRN
jgi:uncharacterized protein